MTLIFPPAGTTNSAMPRRFAVLVYAAGAARNRKRLRCSSGTGMAQSIGDDIRKGNTAHLLDRQPAGLILARGIRDPKLVVPVLLTKPRIAPSSARYSGASIDAEEFRYFLSTGMPRGAAGCRSVANSV